MRPADGDRDRPKAPRRPWAFEMANALARAERRRHARVYYPGKPAGLRAGEPLIHQGATYDSVFLVQSGCLLRCRYLPDGSRQILELALPGDLVGTEALTVDQSDCDVIAREEARLVRWPRAAFAEMIAEHPELSQLYVTLMVRERSIMTERTVSLGRRGARERVAHLLCELAYRLRGPEPADSLVLSLPLSQDDFGDVLGMSKVHFNRTLKTLSAEDLVRYIEGYLEILSLPELIKAGNFDSAYLALDGCSGPLPQAVAARQRLRLTLEGE